MIWWKRYENDVDQTFLENTLKHYERVLFDLVACRIDCEFGMRKLKVPKFQFRYDKTLDMIREVENLLEKAKIEY